MLHIFRWGSFLILTHFFLLGCSQEGFQAKGPHGFADLASTTSTVPPTGNESSPILDPDFTPDETCFQSDAFNACLIYKNPVVTHRGPIEESVYLNSDLTDLQTYGVMIEGTDDSGFLQNPHLVIDISSGQRVQKTIDDNWKFEYKNNDVRRSLAQASAYYAVNRTIEHLEELGGNPTQDLQLLVDAFDSSVKNNAFFNMEFEFIRLGMADRGGFQQELALASEVVIHEYGHAAILKASNDAMKYNSTTHNTFCVEDGFDLCCKSSSGCSAAINEGASDVLAQIMYPDSPSVGNTLSNSLEGLDAFGVYRNADLAANLLSNEAYATPENRNSQYASYNGQIHMMGVVYSSAWRLAWLSARQQGLHQEVEEIFLEHLSALTGTDTFVTALEKILNIDETFYQSRHRQRFLDAFARKGLSLEVQ